MENKRTLKAGRSQFFYTILGQRFSTLQFLGPPRSTVNANKREGRIPLDIEIHAPLRKSTPMRISEKKQKNKCDIYMLYGPSRYSCTVTVAH